MYCSVVKNNLKTFWFSRPPTCHHTSQEKHRCHFGSCPPCHQPCQKVLEKCGHLCPASCHDQALVRQTGKVRTVVKSSCLPVGCVFFSDYLTSNHKGVFRALSILLRSGGEEGKTWSFVLKNLERLVYCSMVETFLVSPRSWVHSLVLGGRWEDVTNKYL